MSRKPSSFPLPACSAEMDSRRKEKLEGGILMKGIFLSKVLRPGGNLKKKILISSISYDH